MEVAISLKEPVVGRQINENDVLFVNVPEQHIKLLSTTYLSMLTADESEALKEIISVMRRRDLSKGIRI
jgi:translation initiation factor 5B